MQDNLLVYLQIFQFCNFTKIIHITDLSWIKSYGKSYSLPVSTDCPSPNLNLASAPGPYESGVVRGAVLSVCFADSGKKHFIRKFINATVKSLFCLQVQLR